MIRRVFLQILLLSGLFPHPDAASSATTAAVAAQQKITQSAWNWAMDFSERKDYFSSCSVVSSSENYVTFKESILKNYVYFESSFDESENPIPLSRAESLTKKLSENALVPPPAMSDLLDPFLRLLKTDPHPESPLPLQERLLQDKREIFSIIMKRIAEHQPALMNDTFRILMGYSQTMDWCAAFIQAMVRGMDCMFQSEVLERYRENLQIGFTSLTDQEIANFASWIWDMPEESIYLASNYLSEAPILYEDTSQCGPGMISVWKQRNIHGHASLVVDENLGTVGGNAGSSKSKANRIVRYLDGSRSQIGGYINGSWRACIPLWN